MSTVSSPWKRSQRKSSTANSTSTSSASSSPPRPPVKHFPETGGSVINISSLVAKSPQPNASIYSATKGAVDAISISLARELGAKNIRVNSVSPGLIETEGVHTAGFMGSDFEKEIARTTPLGRIGQPNDIGKAVAFFASDDAAWITGEAVVVSGGNRA